MKKFTERYSDAGNPKVRLNEKEYEIIYNYREKEKPKEKRILVIGDLHSPFDLEEYHQHCVDTYNKWNCNQVIFIGDVIDNHYSSYHETDVDGYSGGQELELAIDRLKKYYNSFPEADVIIGNHDRLIMRKAQTSWGSWNCANQVKSRYAIYSSRSFAYSSLYRIFGWKKL